MHNMFLTGRLESFFGSVQRPSRSLKKNSAREKMKDIKGL